MTTFIGQLACVTGASSGIGKAIAQVLAANGATVCLLGRRLEALEMVAHEIRAAGGTAYPHEIDITNDAAIHRLKAEIEHNFGQVNLLIHSAGVYATAPMGTAAIADLDRQYLTNVRAPYVITQTFLPLLVPHQSQIVFINSTAGLNASAGVGQYAASKFALKAIADSLRAEVNADGIRVLSVFPGRTATPMQAAIFAMEGRVYQPESLLQPEEVADVIFSSLKLPRSAEVTDINIRGTQNMSVRSRHSLQDKRSTLAIS
jgi:NADP-dependent 3-hydroxy acid dehydrogenase YdfG